MSKQKSSRNAPCPCGSGKKYKQCCLLKENVTAKYTAQGKLKFSAVVLKDSFDNYLGVFKKYSDSNNKEILEEKLKEYSISNKALSKMSKKKLKQIEKQEEKKSIEKLQDHSFQVMDITDVKEENKQKEEFIPSDEDFRISS